MGATDITDERHYVQADPETGEARLLDPRQRLIEILRAFGRLLAVQDRATYISALAEINARLIGGRPERAVVVPTIDTREGPTIDLGAAPELGPLRHELEVFINQLVEIPRSLGPQ